MDLSLAGACEVGMPPDDGLIAEAIAELDSKIEVWAGAVRTVREELTALQCAPAAVEGVVESLAEVATAADDLPVDEIIEQLAVAEAVEVAVEPEPVEAVVEAEPEVEEEPVETDEMLLASLDEDTAKTIRIKRRLCGNSKSVKELLDEMGKS